ncbi:MAG TPA: sorbosone dehydrogenase family protein [Alphaproteobacteria bacterium]|nr:sorbosone dehydrogenase family protein [Alphaproteobacteria bacterium]
MRKLVFAGLAISICLADAVAARDESFLAGDQAYGDWHVDRPGVQRLITVKDLPPPFASKVAANFPSIVSRPDGAIPNAPVGFKVELFAQGLDHPRAIRIAPNGDIFVAETRAGRIRVLRAANGAAKPALEENFASDLDAPFGIAFYPSGADPQFVYVANTDSIVRFPYHSGDTKARGPAETIIKEIPTGGHSTRDIAFSPDGKRLYVSVGSETNVADGMERKSPEEIKMIESAHGLGASWGKEEGRAAVLWTDPDGKTGLHPFAQGIRNCAGLSVQPNTGDVWCVTNERDALGDNLPPDYATRVREGGFYGWPWYYIGAHEDPRHKGERPDLADKVIVPDVLIQPHSAPLQIAFYTGIQFPAPFRGAPFISLHGSWNRGTRTGYKVVCALLDANGKPTGAYQDFLTGFVVSDSGVWGRPVGIAVAHDGALLVGEDAGGTIWRVTYTGKS